ncbi:MAG: indole-3-glycerol phosphate synthase TrpC [Acidobacteriota bacterium]
MSQVPDILRRIVEVRQERVAQSREQATVPNAEPIPQTPANNPFLAALHEKRGRAVIAEVKLGSPRLGSLVDTIDPLALARTYAENGAAALSVVVEPDFFHGSYELLAACHETSGLPTIAKDFIVDPVQFRWARRAGARAVLLIAALYEPDELRRLADLARQHRLVPLIETHELSDLMKLQDGVWELVGVNNRDLRTFEVELSSSMALLPMLPSGALKIAESGIGGADDLTMLRSVGFDGYLIGEALVTADDPAAKLRELIEA